MTTLRLPVTIIQTQPSNHSTIVLNSEQACRNPGLLESKITVRCDICRQFWSYLQTHLVRLKTNHVYLQTILSNDKKYVKNGILAGNL